jgi:6-phosphogluconolactonase
MTSLHFEMLPDAAAVATRAAELVCEAALAPGAVEAMCLSGGSTPKALYQLLTKQPYRSRLPWRRLHFFLGDERFVPPDDERSNIRMIRESLFAGAPEPLAQVHPIPTVGLDLPEAAARYQRELEDFHGGRAISPSRPLFDLVLLGLGADGHTASLLPGQSQIEERQDWVVAVPRGGPEPRVSLTLPALNSTRLALFLVCGEEKRSALARLRAGDESIPAARIHPTGRLVVLADAAATGEGGG